MQHGSPCAQRYCRPLFAPFGLPALVFPAAAEAPAALPAVGLFLLPRAPRLFPAAGVFVLVLDRAAGSAPGLVLASVLVLPRALVLAVALAPQPACTCRQRCKRAVSVVRDALPIGTLCFWHRALSRVSEM